MCRKLLSLSLLLALLSAPCFSEDFILVSVSDLRALWTTQKNYERLTESLSKVTESSGINLTQLGKLLIESNETNERLTLNLQAAEEKATSLENNLATLKPQLESSQAEVLKQDALLKNSDLKIDSIEKSLKSINFRLTLWKWSAIVAGSAALIEGIIIAAR